MLSERDNQLHHVPSLPILLPFRALRTTNTSACPDHHRQLTPPPRYEGSSIIHEDYSLDSHLILLPNYPATKRDPVARWYPGSAMYPCQPLPHGSHLYTPIGAVRSHTPVYPRLNAGHRGIPRPFVRDGIEIYTSHLSELWNSCLGHLSRVDHKDCNEGSFISRLPPPMIPKRCRSPTF